MFADLRDFINRCRHEGQFKLVEGADWNLELGIITEIEAHGPNPSMLLFDKIGDYPPGYRVASNLFAWQKIDKSPKLSRHREDIRRKKQPANQQFYCDGLSR